MTKIVEIYFKDLKPEAQEHLLMTWDTTKDNENWYSVPLAVIEREVEEPYPWTGFAASYRHVSTKILDEFPVTMDKVSLELGAQKHKIGLSMESSVDNPMSTIENFNRQFSLNQPQKEAVEWAWPQEMGENMFAVVTQ